MKISTLLILLIIFPIIAFSPPTGRVPIYCRNGAVTSASAIASEVGRDVLKQGGNAIDAAVATAFALAVTWPTAGNIGGGGFIVFRKSDGTTTTIDFREKAPLAATPNMYLDANGKVIKDLNHVGMLSVGVPGTVAGLELAHRKYGKLPWKKLVGPAVKLASKGIPFSFALNAHSKGARKTWEKFPSTMKSMYKANGDYYEVGEQWKQPDLAKTLKRIQQHGRDGFYKGETAKKLADFMKANGGIITEADLAQYEAIERPALEGNYRGYKIISMPPPSSGGVALVEALNILEGYDLNAMKLNSADYVHVVAEAMRRAFADRAEFLGDPDFSSDMPLQKLTSKEYATTLRRSIDMQTASKSDSSRFGQLYDGSSTTHFSVVDKEGNAVALTYTLERPYGAQVVADGLGFFLNDEMGDFNAMPGKTTRDGDIGTKANLIAPGKRMLSSMTPTIIEKNGKLFMVIGSPGGRTIINTVLQVTLNVIDHKMNIGQAVEAPRFHHQWLPDKLNFELFGLSADTQEKLRARGHVLEELSHMSQGHAMGITVNQETGWLAATADSRSPDGGVAGY